MQAPRQPIKGKPHKNQFAFKDQKTADSVRRQLRDSVRSKNDKEVQPVFTNRKMQHVVKIHEPKPPVVNQQCVVYSCECNLCDARYVGYTRHLHQRV